MGSADPSVRNPSKNTAVGFSIVSYSSMAYNLSPFRHLIYLMPRILYVLAMQAYFVLQLQTVLSLSQEPSNTFF